MTIDSHASDQEGASLSEEQHDVYRYFADSRNGVGTPRRTQNDARHAFGWKWQKLKAVMQEIEDAGYWKLGDNGIPRFIPGVEPPWPEAALVEPLRAPTPVGAPCAPTPTELLTTKESTSLTFPLRGNSGAQQRPASHLTTESYYRLARRYGRDVRDLIDEFSFLIRKTNGGFAPDPINTKALGANFKRWMALDGMSYPVIKQMIHIFVEDYADQKKGAPAWKLFLSQREKLYTQAKERSDRQSTTDYWQRKIQEAGT